MKSPELDPELTAGLLTSLAEWSPFATVPLAHLFMKLGDEDARRGYDEMVLAHPLARQMLEERYLSPVPDLESLAKLPEGSLGRAFETYMTENDLDPVLLRESAFIEAHKKQGEDAGYLSERGFQLHDMFHVLTGFDTSPLGEVRVVRLHRRPDSGPLPRPHHRQPAAPGRALQAPAAPADHGRHHRGLGPRAKGQAADHRPLGRLLGETPRRATAGVPARRVRYFS